MKEKKNLMLSQYVHKDNETYRSYHLDNIKTKIKKIKK